MWYVYIIKSEKFGILYVGYSGSLKRRMFEHNSGLSGFTKPYLPWKLLAYIAVLSENDAKKIEAYLKTGAGRTIMRKRIIFQ